MKMQRKFYCQLRMLLVIIIMVSVPHILLAADDIKVTDCMDRAIERIIEIRVLPEKAYLKTLDGREVALHEFNVSCCKLYPKCNLFDKFYYWPSEIRQVISRSKNGMITHKIRCYHNCLSVFCSDKLDPKKIHGDIAEFYDEQGNFMGLSVYMGDGKYCPLPYSGYGK